MFAVISALRFRCPGNFTLKRCNKRKTVLTELNDLLIRQAPREKVKPRAASHRAYINHTVCILGIARICRKQVLEGVQGSVGEIIARIRYFHTDIVRGYRCV